MLKFLFSALLVTSAPGVVTAQDAFAGRALFETHCATCHGSDARGDGPMAPVLLLQPGDLTQLTIKARGEFPTSLLIAKVDGRDPLMSHGSPMPVFGPYFEGKGVAIRGEDGVLIMTSQPIVDLVTYLETVQGAQQ